MCGRGPLVVVVVGGGGGGGRVSGVDVVVLLGLGGCVLVFFMLLVL